jgi:HK97 gp10 family phage protein
MADGFITVDIQGLQGVEDALASAGPKLAKQALRKALKAGGDVLLKAVQNRCPIATADTPQRKAGELHDALTTKIQMSPKEEHGVIHVGVKYDKKDGSQSPAVYSRFVEFGSIHNPQPKPFFRPGFDSSKDAALEAFTEVLSEAVNTLGEK